MARAGCRSRPSAQSGPRPATARRRPGAAAGREWERDATCSVLSGEVDGHRQILRRIVHLAFDGNDIVLIAAVHQQLTAPARTRQCNVDRAFDAAGRTALDEYAIR